MYGSIAVLVAVMFVGGIAAMTLGRNIGTTGYILPTVFAFGILVIGGIVLFLRSPVSSGERIAGSRSSFASPAMA